MDARSIDQGQIEYSPHQDVKKGEEKEKKGYADVNNDATPTAAAVESCHHREEVEGLPGTGRSDSCLVEWGGLS